MMVTVTCSVCGASVGKMGIGKHAGMHKRQFREYFGRPPEDYEEVRKKLPISEQENTLFDYEVVEA